MEKRVRLVMTVIFVASIVVFGALTMWNCRHTVKQVVVGGDYSEARDTLDSSITSEFAFHDQWINLNGGFQRLLGVTIVRGSSMDVYKLSNGQIMYTLGERGMSSYAKKVVKFRDELEKEGIGFMYVQYPFKIQDDSVMPPGTHTYGNANADDLVRRLRDAGVDTLDIGESIREEGLDWSSLFFKTDHHWKPTTGLWASGKMVEHMSDVYGFEADMSCYDLENYETHVYEDWMLGSIARRTGAWYDGVEDFVLLEPKFETSFDFTGSRTGEKVSRSGSFWDSMYDFSLLEGKKASFDVNTYSTYTGGQYRVAKFVNKNADNDFKVLMIRDSFSCATTPFICMNVAEVRTLDLRRYTKSALEYAKEYKPDLVIVAYNPSAFSAKQFDFDRE